MKSFLIIGLGRFGESVAKSLYSLGNDVMVVDSDPDIIQQIYPVVSDAVAGDCCDINFLKTIDAQSFDCTVVAMSSDMESSLLTTYNLKALGVKMIVAKAASDAHEDILRKIGADKVIFPEKQSAEKLAQALSSNEILEFLELSNKVSIVERELPKKWAGKSLRELSVRNRYGVNIVAIKSADTNDFNVNIDPDRKFAEDDTIVIIGENDTIKGLKK